MPVKTYKIRDIGQVIGGGTPSTSNPDYYGGDIPWLSPKDLSDYKKRYIDHGEKNITKLGLNNSSARLMPAGTILLSSRAPIGYLAIAANHICTNQGFKSIVPDKEKVDSEYLYYTLKNRIEEIKGLGVGTTFAEISGKVLESYEISLPDLEDQRKVSSILSSLDERIEIIQSVNDNLATVRDGIFLNWLNKKIDRNIVSSSPSNGYKSLSQLCRKITDGSHFSPESDSNGKHAMFSVKDMGEYGFNRNDCKMINEESFEMMKSSGCVPEKDDVLIAKDGSYLKQIFLVDSTMDDAILSSIAIFRPDLNAIYPEILLSYLKSPAVYNYVKDNFVSGSAVPRIVLKSFKQLNLAVPPIEDQNEIIESLRSIRFEIASNLMVLNKLIELRDYLLPKLMSGEIDVSPLSLPTKYSFSWLSGHELLVSILYILLIYHGVM